MGSEVTEKILAFHRGVITFDQVVQYFRERSWPRSGATHDPQTYLEMAAIAQRDPEPDVPGSFDDVVAAYDRGLLTRDQYRTLAEAAAESMRRGDSAKKSE
jgi:hypothetical protein